MVILIEARMPSKQFINLDFVKEHMLSKGLRNSSSTTYISRIRTILTALFGDKELTKIQLNKQKKKILDFIVKGNTSANNRKVAVMSLSHLLSAYGLDTQFLYTALSELHEQSDAESLTSNKPDVIHKLNEIDFQAMKNKIESYKNPNDRLICACYSLMCPLRQQDWNNIPVLTTKPEEPINHVNLKKKQLVIHEHKTSKAHGTKVIDLPQQLVNEIKRYIADPAKNNILLPFTTSNMSRKIKQVWGVSSQMLRKAYVSQYTPSMSSEELIKNCKMMGHRLTTEVLHYRKNLKVTPELQPEEPIPDSASECSVESQDASTQT